MTDLQEKANMNTLPYAVRLADWVDSYRTRKATVLEEAVAELRRLHEENQTLKQCLKQAQDAAVILSKANIKALEALETHVPYTYKDREYEPIQALRQALAQPEQYDQTALELCEKCGWKAVIPDEGCLVCARKNQKPVAWLNITDEGERYINFFNSIKDFSEGTKFYTAPPKREWVGLTDEDKQEACIHMQKAKGGFWEFADYLDAKLKEKNT